MQQESSLVPSEAARVLISVNPIAGARSAQCRADRLVELLTERGFATEVFTDPGMAADRANQCQAQGRLRALVGVGGDGTAAELANRTVAGVPLTLLPSGNENLLARYLKLAQTPETICQTIADGRAVQLDVGKANGRIFLLMLGCGFDAEVVRRVHSGRRGHIRKRSYAKPILDTIRSYNYPRLRLYWDDRETAGAEVQPPHEARWLFVFNLPCYGGGLQLAPQADGTDGSLDVCAFRRGSWWHGLRYAGAVLLGRHERLADCTMHRVRRLRITSEAEVPYQLDGDPGGFLPVEIEVVSGRLTVLVPGSHAKEQQRQPPTNP